MHKTIELDVGNWRRVTGAEVQSLSLFNLGGSTVMLQRGGENAPYKDDDVPEGEFLNGCAQLAAGASVLNEALDDVWPGAVGGHVWCLAPMGGQVSVSHA